MCHACLALYPRFIPNIYLKMSLNVASTDMELEHGINMELERSLPREGLLAFVVRHAIHRDDGLPRLATTDKCETQGSGGCVDRNAERFHVFRCGYRSGTSGMRYGALRQVQVGRLV